jgi:nitrite reductase/ring-hydroxylating ferredoxin subunit
MSGAPAGSRRFPFPLPDGWFPVAWSDELATGEVRPLRYFGTDLVAWRAEGGAVRVFDAFCPHLGAHLAHGGRVMGDTLRCPFHGWRFDGAGSCIEVPYARRIPPRARVRAWPVCEKNGLVAVWHHSRGEPPVWEIPDVPEYGSPEWTPFERREWIVRSRNQELAENTVDQAHFKYVHGTSTVAETEFRTDGPVLEVVSKSKMETPRGVVDGRIEIRTHGFGFGVTRFRGIVETVLITAGAPIDLESVHMRLSFSVRKLANSDATKGVGRAFIAEVEKQFSEDIPIWENKVHWEKPLLCDGDGPIAMLRSWGRQFYSA